MYITWLLPWSFIILFSYKLSVTLVVTLAYFHILFLKIKKIDFSQFAKEWQLTTSFFFLQVLGASWYVLSVDRYTSCWKKECGKETSPKCILNYLDCDTFNHQDREIWAKSTNVFKSCDPNNQEIDFDYGIFKNAVTKNVVSSVFIKKYFYCLWWGLQQLRCIFILSMHQIHQFFSILTDILDKFDGFDTFFSIILLFSAYLGVFFAFNWLE